MNGWPKQIDCARLFGNPSEPHWSDDHLTRIVPPYKLVMGTIEVHSFQVNKICAASVLGALTDYWNAVGHDYEQVVFDGAHVFSGSWAVRAMRGKKTISMHAYGLAIDINAPKNPLGRRPGLVKGSFTSTSRLVKAFRSRGAVWGGDWKTRPDGMHFQFAIV